MRRHRRLPDDITIHRLYWLNGWTAERIGRKYGVSCSAVCRLMKRIGVKARPAYRRIQEHCIVRGCGEMVCFFKKWRPGGRITWGASNRCAAHHHEHQRTMQRDWWARNRHRYTKNPPYAKRANTWHPNRKPLGTSLLIRAED